MPQLPQRCHAHRGAERMAELSLLPEAAANSNLACCASENECGVRDAGASDMLFSPGEGVRGMLPEVRPLSVHAVRFAARSGARLPHVL
jgi:hypothetical protein